MRLSIVAMGDGTPLQGLIGTPDRLRVEIEDRVANGEALPSEHVVRLPRSLGRIRRTETPECTVLRIKRFILGNPWWPLDYEEPRRLPIEVGEDELIWREPRP